ncbi:MAG: hypothetical protein V4850_16370 [Myxococcota bacterium]
MLATARETALTILDDLLEGIEYARAHDGGLWWPTVSAALSLLERHPLTREVLRSVPRGPDVPVLRSPVSAPADMAAWGRLAYAGIKRIPDERGGVRHADPHPDPYSIHSLLDGHRSPEFTGKLNGLYVRPLVAWLRAEVLSAVQINALIERWIQRSELFGIGALEQNEAALQADLHRFLFDAGLDPHTGFDRELPIARGRVDFLLRENEPVPVELKLWRGGTTPGVSAWTYQARTYGAQMRVRRAYLVVADASTEERLAPAGALANGEPLDVAGVQVHVRFLDFGRHAPSKDYDKRKAREVTIDALLLGIETDRT